ncbi:MAG: peptidoglycan-associated lipoprotein Pal [Desulfobacterales bacterium]|nr:peptidoglycan-associated lipoprotein Pal [Desulfobacterales bacterium]MDH4010351.1 peptidoglycan-associated lipoprotein Pal [Desulfobacterales bacterium]
MQKKFWLMIALLLVIPGLLFTVGCQKKAVSQTKAPAPAAAPAPAPAPKAAPMAPPPSGWNITQNNIYYEFDKSTLTPMAQDTLMRHAAWLRENADVSVTIEGHADERGTNEYNLALGDRRADSAKAFLVDLGIASSRLTTISYGEERPLCMQQNEECWTKNRRGHFIVN